MTDATITDSSSTLLNQRDRWFAVGHSRLPDPVEAGTDATRAAITGRDTKLLIVFASRSYDLPTLLASINDTAGDVPLVGCTTAGEIGTDGAADRSLIVAALGGPGFDVTTAVVTGTRADQRQAGDDVASALAERAGEPRASRVMMLLADGLLADQDEVLRGVYDAVGASVPLVGGFAGDDWNFDGTYQFRGREVHSDAVVGAILDSDGPIAIGIRHGWRRVGEPLLVTSADNNRVYKLDDEPAIEAYKRVLNVPEECLADPEKFALFSAQHPLGVSRRSGEEVRVIGSADLSDGSLEAWSRVPQGGMAWLMEGDIESVQRSTAEACEDACRGLDGSVPIGVVAFDCVGRRKVIGDDGLPEEVAAIATGMDAPVAGFYTYGEIARVSGPNGFHNQTLVLLAFG